MTRAVAGVVINLQEPAISSGAPSLPLYWTKIKASVTLRQGSTHIHAIADPNPIWDPRTGGWTHLPPPAPKPSITPGGNGAGDVRWTVDSLPDPGGFSGGWYWLGDPDPRDNTAGIRSSARQWTSDRGGGLTWHSFYPFKPSVNSYNGYILGERTVRHRKGVHFNSHYAEHMWLDFGGTQSQPFTWIVVATVMSDPFAGYQHWILDAGRNPDSVGFPRLGANFYGRRINDNLPYRTSLSLVNNTTEIQSSSTTGPLRARGAGGHHPRMFVGIFNGTSSTVCSYDPFGKYRAKGKVTKGPQSAHRFMTIGRQQGWISQSHATNMLVFEIRYWRHALTPADLDKQYAQLSSTHQFDAYRSL